MKYIFLLFCLISFNAFAEAPVGAKFLNMPEGPTPTPTPSAGYQDLFFNSSDHNLYRFDHSGTATLIGGGGGGSQTPWTQNIDGSGYSLSNTSELDTNLLGLDSYQPNVVSNVVDNISAENLTPTSILSVVGKINQAEYFNGNNSTAIGDDSGIPVGSSHVSYSLWVKFAGPTYGRQVMLSYGGSTPNTNFALGIDSNGAVSLGGLNWWTNVTGASITDLNWHNIVVGFDGTNYYTYLDGVKATNLAKPNTIDLNGVFALGHESEGVWNMAGSLDDVRIYSSDITSGGTSATIVNLIYNSGNGTESESGSLGTNLIRHYKMNDGGAPTQVKYPIDVNLWGNYTFGTGGLSIQPTISPVTPTGNGDNLFFNGGNELGFIDSQANSYKVLTTGGSTVVGPLQYGVVYCGWPAPYAAQGQVWQCSNGIGSIQETDVNGVDQSAALGALATFQSGGGAINVTITDINGNVLSTGSVTGFTCGNVSYGGLTCNWNGTGQSTTYGSNDYYSGGQPGYVYFMEEVTPSFPALTVTGPLKTNIGDTQIAISESGILSGNSSIVTSGDYHRLLLGGASDDSISPLQTIYIDGSGATMQLLAGQLPAAVIGVALPGIFSYAIGPAGDHAVVGVADTTAIGGSTEAAFLLHNDPSGNQSSLVMDDDVGGNPYHQVQVYLGSATTAGTQMYVTPTAWSLMDNGGDAPYFSVISGTTVGTGRVLISQPTDDGVSSLQVNGMIASSAAQTTLTGSSGTAICYQPFSGIAYKKALCYLSGYTDTGTQVFTFPVAFSNTPFAYGDPTALAGAVVTTTTLTFNVTSDTGFFFLEGY